MDAMIEYMSENYGDQFNLFYSTPSVYVDAVASYNVTWPTKYDDMFPYSDNPNGYFGMDQEVIQTGKHISGKMESTFDENFCNKVLNSVDPKDGDFEDIIKSEDEEEVVEPDPNMPQ